MNTWNTYVARLGVSSDSAIDPKQLSAQDHIRGRMRRKVTATLSYKRARINDQDWQIAVVDDAENLNIKKIFSMPNEVLPHGSLVEWNNSIWLITEVDVRDELCTKGKMKRCNYYLRWIDDVGNIISRWCVVEDGTKYLIGERSEDMMTIGDARIALTIGKDPDTDKLGRGKRFLIDDPDSKDILAYQITKPNKLFNVYDGKGVFRFILNEVNKTDDDNDELRIADYYSWVPSSERTPSDVKTGLPFEEIAAAAKDKQENMPSDIEERKVWL